MKWRKMLKAIEVADGLKLESGWLLPPAGKG
jgi:hypothetical protein